MTSLTNIKSLLVQFRFFIITSIVIFFLGIILIAQFVLKKPQPVILEVEQPKGLPSLNSSTKIDLQGKIPELPQNSSIISLTEKNPLSNQEAKTLVTKLKFTQEPQVVTSQSESIYLWHEDKNSFTFKPKTQEIKFEQQITYPITDKNQVSLDKSVDILTKFLDSLGINLNDYSFVEYKLLDNLNSRSNVPLENAHFIRLSYYQKIDNLPMVSNAPGEQFSIDSYLSASGNIVSVKIIWPQKNFQKSGLHKAKNFNEVFEELKTGRGLILTSVGEHGRVGTNDSLNISSLKISSVLLAYLLLTSNPQQLTPSILFRGDAILTNNQTESITIAVPLLKNSQFINPLPNSP